ncbi:sterol carrier protein [Ureibacillus massiliensis 4400831 = CIP 108448 = CCUG 49529]|uniref:Sterol carrier protein n=1 Tax=Ureibacillus massiliensis 4400831 = CIP 108448 = CCUG 49529 TaxID=1211035 RepID=A0A0A3IYQ7_9BACL|nr:SCP2 sterol-binding domain-containing protein [Ureibacillus massiliensis]KGR89806.1 sterol carrier protein [Ureibacillus massiliensis 4400831 = CIP 108448 = CCUG 49529]
MAIAALTNLINKIENDGAGLKGYEKVIQFEFTDLSEKYNVQFMGDKATLVGDQEKIACTVQITSDNFEKLISGELNPQTAFFFGKIKAKGDMAQLLKLSSILDYYQ